MILVASVMLMHAAFEKVGVSVILVASVMLMHAAFEKAKVKI